ncbi:MAG: hypothetical protein NYU90_01710 [Aigarchaeota archaeon]|nr:hypothetical protein [Candidatus Calditenuis fumarioli]
MISLVTALISASEVGSKVAQVIKQVMLTLFEVATPIIDALGIAMILGGLLLAIGFRQEGYGIRLAIGGVLALVFTHLVVPLLLGFI